VATNLPSSDDLIKYADTAMYRAKKVGRNNFQFFFAAMKEQALPRQDADA
jgi:predicted signal transduction protein with EAL and GGDEF domain